MSYDPFRRPFSCMMPNFRFAREAVAAQIIQTYDMRGVAMQAVAMQGCCS